MVTALITFLGTSAGGSIVGFLVESMSRKREERQRDKDRLHEERMASSGNFRDYSKAVFERAPGTLRRITRKRSFWGLSWETITYRVFPTNIPTTRAIAVAISTVIVVLAYTLTMGWFAYNMDASVHTLNPDPDPIKLDLLLFGFEWPRNKAYTLTAGGIAYLMAYPLVFIISMVTTGTVSRLAR